MAKATGGSRSDLAVTAEYARSIPEVLQVVSPMPLDISCEPGPTSDTPIRSPSFLEPRYYTVRMKCRQKTTAHAYFMGLATDPSEEMTTAGAERIARLLNNQKLVMSIPNGADKCDAPFGHATLADHVEEDFFLKIEGIAYHCHCDDKFSSSCWKAAFGAAEKAAMVCRELRIARAARIV
uniref:UL55 protein n=1 Tax=Anatid alphaherpesvirus 2 TaxID=3080522 RepID=A0AAU0K8A4_9ALPH